MVLIREHALTDVIIETLLGKKVGELELDSALRTCKPNCDKSCYRCPGINFDYTSTLTATLLKRAYDGLTQKTTHETYAARVSHAIQQFANDFPDSKNTMCYPHFLLHGIDLPTTQHVAEKIEDNARIMHETRATAEEYNTGKRITLPNGLSLGHAGGDTDDHFSTCYFLAQRDVWAGPSHSYLAKFSIFRDMTNKTIVGLTVQGQTASIVRNKDGREVKNKERGKAYARLTAQLDMDPRTYTIRTVMGLMSCKGFTHVKVIKAAEHPFAIENHSGFLARYDDAVRAAGITQENGCYLTAKLR